MCTVMDRENLKNLKASSTYGAELRGYSAAAVGDSYGHKRYYVRPKASRKNEGGAKAIRFTYQRRAFNEIQVH